MRSHQRKLIFLIGLFSAVTAGAAFMTYTGPNRTVTEDVTECRVVLEECQYIASKHDYKWHHIDSWACGQESKPWLAYENYQGNCASYNVGHTRWGKQTVITQQTVTYPPATVGCDYNCPTPGQNGWCAGGGQAIISGAEPVSGYSIFGIEGQQNGVDFACTSGNTCPVPLAEGENQFSFWALSTFTDTSAMGTAVYKQDSVAPQIDAHLTGVQAASGWFRSSVNYTASAVDSTSGLTASTCSLDGAVPASCSAGTISAEGPHQLTFDAYDNAGNHNQLSQAVNIDTGVPSLDVKFNGVNGQNGWYLSANVTATTSDPLPGSGVSSLQYALNHGGWTDFSDVYNFPDGESVVDIRAIDLAENTAQANPISAKVDSTPPDVTPTIQGTTGENGWYTQPVSVSATASDATSGMHLFEFNQDAGGWNPYVHSLLLSDGVHPVSFYAEDVAGQSRQVDLSIGVDTRPPLLTTAITGGDAGTNGWYTSPVTLQAGATDPAPGSGIAAFTVSIDGATPVDASQPQTISEGRHHSRFVTEDQAGWQTVVERDIHVDVTRPTLQVDTSLPLWNRGVVNLAGKAADALSGLARVEISTDNGASWQAASGSEEWTTLWDTTTAADGERIVRIRSVDQAGLIHESAFTVGVDNHGPQIDLRDRWGVDDTIPLNVTDAGSGVAQVVVKIFDPLNRYPMRVLDYDGGVFPLDFRWDRHFADGTLAAPGDYTFLVSASDNFGNQTYKTAAIHVPVIGKIFGGYHTATPLPTLQPSLTPTPRGTVPTLVNTPRPTGTELALVLPVMGGSTPAAPAASPAPHGSPAAGGFTSFVQEVFFPASDKTSGETGIHTGAASPISADPGGTLFGSIATSTTAGLAAYYLQKKKEEEEERRAAIEAQIEREKKIAEKQREAWKERNAQNEVIKLRKDMADFGLDQAAASAVMAEYRQNGADAAHAKIVEITARKETPPANVCWKVDPSPAGLGKPQEANPPDVKPTIEHTREKFDPVFESIVEKGSTWNAQDGVVPIVKKQETGNWFSNLIDKAKTFISDHVDTGYESDRNKSSAAVWKSTFDTPSYENIHGRKLVDLNQNAYSQSYSSLEGKKYGSTANSIITTLDGSEDVVEASKIKFTELESGNICVSVDDFVGEKVATRQAIFGRTGYGPAATDIGYAGTKYTAEALAATTANGLLKSSISGSAWVAAGATSLIGNGLEYGYGSQTTDEFFTRTVKNQDFWASTIADTIVTLSTGVAAALIVGGAITFAVSAGFVAAATAPLWLVIGGTVVVGALIGGLLGNWKVNDYLQNIINSGINLLK